MKLRITILKYHSWYLCQISLQIMLLPIQTILMFTYCFVFPINITFSIHEVSESFHTTCCIFFWKLFFFCHLGPVVQMAVNANPGLNFNPGFFIFLSKALSGIIFSILFRVSNHQVVGKEN